MHNFVTFSLVQKHKKNLLKPSSQMLGKTSEIVNKAATRTGSNQPVSGQLTIDLQGDRCRAVAGQVRSSDFDENIA